MRSAAGGRGSHSATDAKTDSNTLPPPPSRPPVSIGVYKKVFDIRHDKARHSHKGKKTRKNGLRCRRLRGQQKIDSQRALEISGKR